MIDEFLIDIEKIRQAVPACWSNAGAMLAKFGLGGEEPWNLGDIQNTFFAKMDRNQMH